MGDFSEIFLGNQETFRGCIEDVMFNGIDVLDQAKRVSELMIKQLPLCSFSARKLSLSIFLARSLAAGF